MMHETKMKVDAIIYRG